MASEALQNQLILNSMFERSIAPVAQALEERRKREQAQQDWERAAAQRERELMMEQTFRSQQSREQIAAQVAAAKAQQEAIGAREIASEDRASQRGLMEKIDSSPYLTEKQKEEARTNPVKAKEYGAKIVNLAVDEDLKSAHAIANQAEETMKSAVYAMANEARRLPPDVVNKVNTTWLAGQPEKVQRVLYPILKSGGTLTTETVDKALNDARGIFGMGIGGISDDSIMQASIQYRSALNDASGGSKEPNPEVQRLVLKYQGLQEQLKNLAATPTGRLAANKFVQEKQAESDDLVRKFKKKNDLVKSLSISPNPQDDLSLDYPTATVPGGGFVTEPVPVKSTQFPGMGEFTPQFPIRNATSF